jgi:hypothetical protein
MPQDVKPDGWAWQALERLPRYVVLKLPGVAVSTALKYLSLWYGPPDVEGSVPMLRRREWHIEVDSLPAAAVQKLATTGELTIKVGGYSGTYDYTWNQVRTFIRNLRTGRTE